MKSSRQRLIEAYLNGYEPQTDTDKLIIANHLASADGAVPVEKPEVEQQNLLDGLPTAYADWSVEKLRNEITSLGFLTKAGAKKADLIEQLVDIVNSTTSA